VQMKLRPVSPNSGLRVRTREGIVCGVSARFGV